MISQLDASRGIITAVFCCKGTVCSLVLTERNAYVAKHAVIMEHSLSQSADA